MRASDEGTGEIFSYLDFGDRLPDEYERNRAQTFAAEAVHCLAAIRATSA